jgi:signal transduction histidine kinase
LVLKPIERITSAAQEIQATDLSQRIHLGGPDDELRHLADTFDDLLERIDDAFEAQRRLIAEVSHELRNPLATIRTNLEVTLDDPSVDRDDLLHTAAVVDRAAERMSKLVDDLLATARNEAPSLAMEPLDVAVVVREAAEEFSAPAAARDLRVVAEAEPGLWVTGDRVALKQCAANLLANAVRLAPEGSTVTVRGGRSGPWVHLAVEDEGPGISPDDHERVFQRFWRNNPRDRDQGRSGLGLSIVRQIAEAHRGDVGLVSSPGTGSTFSVRLPAIPAPEPGPNVLAG